MENEKTLSSLTSYVKNNLRVEEIKITPTESLKSSKFGEIDSDIETLIFYDAYKNSL